MMGELEPKRLLLAAMLLAAMLLTACAFGCTSDTQGDSPVVDGMDTASADGAQATSTDGASPGNGSAQTSTGAANSSDAGNGGTGGSGGNGANTSASTSVASDMSTSQSSISSTGSGMFGGFAVTTTGGSNGANSASNTGTSNASNTSSTGGTSASDCEAWPTATDSQSVSATIAVSGTYDGEFRRYSGSGPLGTGSQSEDQGPLFELAPGATLRNVILGNPAADGIHCRGNCTLENVWWEDVGEDAATFYGDSGSTSSTVRCGGARNADDKIFQHNGAGTVTIQDFVAESFGKLYRSCGNCSNQYERHVVLERITASGGSSLVGINTNYGDSATFSDITVMGNITICQRYTGNSSGAEPIQTGSGPDGQYCLYDNSDITTR